MKMKFPQFRLRKCGTRNNLKNMREMLKGVSLYLDSKRKHYQRIRNTAYKLAFEPVIILTSIKNVRCLEIFSKISNRRKLKYKLLVSPLYCQARKLPVFLVCIGRIFFYFLFTRFTFSHSLFHIFTIV